MDDVEALVYVLASLGSRNGLPWRHAPHAHIARAKRRMVRETRRLDADLVDGCAAAVCGALEALWAEVVSCHEAGRGVVDYDACLAALGGRGEEWERRALL